MRLRAEKRAGELLREMADGGERAQRGEAKKSQPATFRLDDLGVSKSQSSRWQRLAELEPARGGKWSSVQVMRLLEIIRGHFEPAQAWPREEAERTTMLAALSSEGEMKSATGRLGVSSARALDRPSPFRLWGLGVGASGRAVDCSLFGVPVESQTER
jgi:hypothetical protein